VATHQGELTGRRLVISFVPTTGQVGIWRNTARAQKVDAFTATVEEVPSAAGMGLFGVVVDLEVEVDVASVDAGDGHRYAVPLATIGEFTP
jgi:hypothetical protein